MTRLLVFALLLGFGSNLSAQPLGVAWVKNNTTSRVRVVISSEIGVITAILPRGASLQFPFDTRIKSRVLTVYGLNQDQVFSSRIPKWRSGYTYKAIPGTVVVTKEVKVKVLENGREVEQKVQVQEEKEEDGVRGEPDGEIIELED